MHRLACTRFESLSLASETEDEIEKLRNNLEFECNQAIGNRDALDKLAENYFTDVQISYKRGFEMIMEQYLWAYRWATSLEHLCFEGMPLVVKKFSEVQFFDGILVGKYRR